MNLQVSHIEISFCDRAAGKQELCVKIALLSDLHYGAIGVREQLIYRAVEITNSLKPDIIAVCGDFVTHSVKHIYRCADILCGLSAGYGVFGVLGNHDHWLDADVISDVLQGYSSVKMLRNTNHKIKLPGNKTLWLAGVDDPYTGHHNLESALRGAAKPIILLSHSPDIFPEAQKNNIDLVLTGHTHGGQIRLPWIKPWIPSKYGARYCDGLFLEDNSYLYVSRGIGLTGLPFRFRCPPEVSLIVVK